MSVLDDIMAHKRLEVAQQAAARPLVGLRAAARAMLRPLDFVAALRRAPARPALIAEIKRRSPSRGLLVADFDPLRLARLYRQNGAACISILTDERFFGGELAHLTAVKAHEPDMPLLRKDFICDPYQIYQARAAGADAVLLIAAVLTAAQLCELHALAAELGMAALVEVHTEAELEHAMACRPKLIGINNRDLHRFTVDLATTERLARLIPADVCIVAESGIHSMADLARLQAIPRPGGAAGVDAVLVGEALVAADDVGAKVRELAGR
ncbi:MAG: indole-3-glycerol phosphate synthase TrpC [Anaerolineae bacterium]|nr:indole-3-glycerol phosphate synthase TrpC [Anaerolineae bacterium]